MVIVTNKSNKPCGIIGSAWCLPDQKITIKDKEAFCDVFDDDGVKTGEKQLLPGLKALEMRGYISIEIKEDAPKKVVAAANEEQEEVKKATTRKRTSKKATE